MVRELRIEAAQRQLVVERRAGDAEQVLEHMRQRHERRPGVERRPTVADHGELPAGDIVAFENHHPAPDGGEADGDSEAAHTGTDDDDVGPLSHGPLV